MELEDFKDKWDLTLFILMNIFGAPLTVIAIAVWLGWWGFFGNVVLFILFYKWWKRYGNHKGKLGFGPSFNWAGKSYRIKK